MRNVVAIVLCLGAGACARAPTPAEDWPGTGYNVTPSDDAAVSDLDAGLGEGKADASVGVTEGKDAAAMVPRDAATDAAIGRDAASDASLAIPDAAAVDAQASDARVRDAEASTTDGAVAAPDAATSAEAGVCDLAPCLDHCPLATPCCTALGTCACEFVPGLCVLPPIGLN